MHSSRRPFLRSLRGLAAGIAVFSLIGGTIGCLIAGTIGGLIGGPIGGLIGFGNAQADELENIQQAGTLRVAVPQDFPPFGSVGTDLKPRGYEIDMVSMTLLMVTHEMRFARDVGNKLIFMHHGRIHEAGDPKEVFINPKTPELANFVGAVQAA